MSPLLYVLGLMTALSAQEPTATTQTFTSTDGPKLTTAIIGKTGTTIIIRRANNGVEFTLPLNRLSKAN